MILEIPFQTRLGVCPQSQRAFPVRCPLISLRTCWSHFMASGQQSVNTAVLAVPPCSRSAPTTESTSLPVPSVTPFPQSSAPVTDQNNVFTRRREQYDEAGINKNWNKVFMSLDSLSYTPVFFFKAFANFGCAKICLVRIQTCWSSFSWLDFLLFCFVHDAILWLCNDIRTECRQTCAALVQKQIHLWFIACKVAAFIIDLNANTSCNVSCCTLLTCQPRLLLSVKPFYMSVYSGIRGQERITLQSGKSREMSANSGLIGPETWSTLTCASPR